MQRIAINVEPTPEVVVRITWRQWEDGRWEAWLVDGSGLPPQQVRDRQALALFLQHACHRAAGTAGETHS
jgi:hypothetical protein